MEALLRYRCLRSTSLMLQNKSLLLLWKWLFLEVLIRRELEIASSCFFSDIMWTVSGYHIFFLIFHYIRVQQIPLPDCPGHVKCNFKQIDEFWSLPQLACKTFILFYYHIWPINQKVLKINEEMSHFKP